MMLPAARTPWRMATGAKAGYGRPWRRSMTDAPSPMTYTSGNSGIFRNSSTTMPPCGLFVEGNRARTGFGVTPAAQMVVRVGMISQSFSSTYSALAPVTRVFELTSIPRLISACCPVSARLPAKSGRIRSPLDTNTILIPDW